MPAQAGIQGWRLGGNTQSLDSGFRRNDEKEKVDFEILSKWRKSLDNDKYGG
jgi:hypothetical protein